MKSVSSSTLSRCRLIAHNPTNDRPSSATEEPSVLPNFATPVALRAGMFAVLDPSM